MRSSSSAAWSVGSSATRSAASSGCMTSRTSAARSMSRLERISILSSSPSSSRMSARRSSVSSLATACMRPAGSSRSTSATSAGLSSLIWARIETLPWTAAGFMSPVTSRTGTVKDRWPPTARLPVRTYSEVSCHSRGFVWVMATSMTTASSFVSRRWTWRSISWASTSVSAGRWEKRRMLTIPVVMTWPLAIEVTRVSGRKTRRFPTTSTTRPTASGSPFRRKRATTS